MFIGRQIRFDLVNLILLSPKGCSVFRFFILRGIILIEFPVEPRSPYEIRRPNRLTGTLRPAVVPHS